MYQCLKKPSQLWGKFQILNLTHENYTLKHLNYTEIFEYLDQLKNLEKIINITDIMITPNKHNMLCLIIAL